MAEEDDLDEEDLHLNVEMGIEMEWKCVIWGQMEVGSSEVRCLTMKVI